MSTAPARPYGGRSADERRAERRARLIDAGLDVVAEKGWPNTTVRDVCSRAKLTERYFYEAFGDRQGLLLALFDQVAEGIREAVVEVLTTAPSDAVGRARTAIAACVKKLTADPRQTRIAFLEAPDDAALQERRRAAILMFAHLVRDQAAEFYGVSGPGKKDAELTSHVLVGGLAQLLVAWQVGDVKVGQARLIEHATQLFVAVAGVRSGSSS